MIRRRSSPISVKTTRHNLQSWRWPMIILRGSFYERQESRKILANGSSKTAIASGNSMLCLRTLAAALRGSHSKTRLKLIPQSNRHVVDRIRTAYHHFPHQKKVRHAYPTRLPGYLATWLPGYLAQIQGYAPCTPAWNEIKIVTMVESDRKNVRRQEVWIIF